MIKSRPRRSLSTLEPMRLFTALPTINDLAASCRYPGSLQDDEKILARVLKIRIRVLGETHYDTLASMVDLASIYHDQNCWKEAALDMKVMDVRLGLLGDRHPDALSATANLAVTFSMLGYEDQAEFLKSRVEGLSSEIMGDEHPFTLHAMTSLAATYRNLGKFPKAEELGAWVTDLKSKALGQEHSNTLFSVADYAATLSMQGHDDRAEVLEAHVMDVSLRTLGEKHPFTFDAMVNLAVTYGNQGQWSKAESLLTRAMRSSSGVKQRSTWLVYMVTRGCGSRRKICFATWWKHDHVYQMPNTLTSWQPCKTSL
jgi:hypothetical protein